MARGTPASDCDHRSLARQLAEDEEIIEVEEEMVVKDYGDGVSKFLSSSESDNCPGFSINQGARKEGHEGSGLLACDFPGDVKTPTKTSKQLPSKKRRKIQNPPGK